jgi:hypothetical protein
MEWEPERRGFNGMTVLDVKPDRETGKVGMLWL